MSAPSFSVITPSFNQARYLRTNIEAVLAQNYPAVEHIVVDADSSDGTIDILKEFPSLVWTSEPDKGQSDAINKAISRSSNEWIVWVNSDDYLLPNALTALAAYIEKHHQSHVIYSNIVQVDENNDTIKRSKPNYSPWKLRHWWWANLQIWQPGLVFRRDVALAVGRMNIDFHFAMDFDFILRVQAKYRLDYLDDELVAFRRHPEQKGAAGEAPFIDERIAATLAFWRRRSISGYCIYALILYFVKGSLLFVEGLRRYESGDQTSGIQLIGKGLRRNPLAILRPEHLGFWIRKVFGAERYYRYR